MQLVLSGEALEALAAGFTLTIELQVELIRVRRWYIDDMEVWRETIDCTPWSASPLPEITDLRLARSGGSLQMEWDSPGSNTATVRLYRRPIGATAQSWLCEESATEAGSLSLPLPAGNLAFLVGVESGVLAGSIGETSDGEARTVPSCP